MTASPTTKKTLRKEAMALRDQLHAIYGMASAEKAAGHGLSYLSVLPKGTVIALYHPMNSELDPCFLATDLMRKGYKVALPVVEALDAPLAFRLWATGDPLEDGVFNTKHPVAEAPTVVPDVILAPMLGFTMAGYRLGYGGGFYDRTLVTMPGTRFIGFAFMGQMLDDMPVEKHDIPVEAVITETGIILCGK